MTTLNITTIAKQFNALNDKMQGAQESFLTTILVAGRACAPIAQDSKEHKELNTQLLQAMVDSKRYTPESARVVSVKLVRILIFASNGFVFTGTNWMLCYKEASEATGLTFWTKKAAKGSKSAPAGGSESESESEKKPEPLNAALAAAMVAINADPEGFASRLPHACQIRLAKALYSLMGEVVEGEAKQIA